MDEATCWSLLAATGHGCLATHHPSGRIDLVPVVFAVDQDRILMPVDTVKAKETTRLQRLADLAGDPRCTLLVERYDDDWSQLWWVRVQGSAAVVEVATEAAGVAALAARHPPYRAAGAIVALVALRPEAIRGWSQIERSADRPGVGP